MDTRLQKALLNAAVFLYAVLGFSVSILPSLFSLLGPRQPSKPTNLPLSKPHLQPLVPRTRPLARNNLRSCSDKPSTAAPAEPTLDDTQRRRKMLAAHRRSRSIPLITLDYFGSTENLHKIPQHDSDVEPRSHFGPLPVRKPLTFVIPPPPGRDRVDPPWTAGYDTEKSGFKLTNLFFKEKRREKEKKRKVGEGIPPSSPQPLESSAKQPRVCRKRRKSEVSKHPLLSKDGQENVLRPPVRRVSSAPMEDRLSMKFDLNFSRTVEKKKSGTLRTQPYEAPFFCPPPVQPIRLKSQSTLDLRSNALHKPLRTSTMKT